MIKVLQIKEETESGTELMCGRYKVLYNISDTATRGEVLKTMFPDMQIKLKNEGTLIRYTLDGLVGNTVTIDWWNAPYIAESEE